jgi:hypothetical protein
LSTGSPIRRLPNDDIDPGRHLEKLGTSSFGTQRKHAVSQPEAVEPKLDAVRKPRSNLHPTSGQIRSDAE